MACWSQKEGIRLILVLAETSSCSIGVASDMKNFYYAIPSLNGLGTINNHYKHSTKNTKNVLIAENVTKTIINITQSRLLQNHT